jgi:hypothetical protein
METRRPIMAFQITINVNDAQQARLQTWGEKAYPGAAPAALKDMLERAAKQGMRKELEQWIVQAANREMQATVETEDALLSTEFPDMAPETPNDPADDFVEQTP